jgi:hypothetical protein
MAQSPNVTARRAKLWRINCVLTCLFFCCIITESGDAPAPFGLLLPLYLFDHDYYFVLAAMVFFGSTFVIVASGFLKLPSARGWTFEIGNSCYCAVYIGMIFNIDRQYRIVPALSSIPWLSCWLLGTWALIKDWRSRING